MGLQSTITVSSPQAGTNILTVTKYTIGIRLTSCVYVDIQKLSNPN